MPTPADVPLSSTWLRSCRTSATRAAGLTSLLALAAGTSGCLDRPLETVSPRTTSTFVDVIGSKVAAIDLLLVIDNSGSMADKQRILEEAVPKLVERLVTPQCVDADQRPASPPKASVDGKCEDPGYEPEFPPVLDINIGVISSSIGSVGSSLCDGPTSQSPHGQDRAHLLSATNPVTRGEEAETYQGLDFLAWDPDGQRRCPDRPDEVCAGSDDSGALIETLRTMVVGVGESGCGFEAPLEAAYRFLVDPSPHLDVAPGGAPEGRDDPLLDQRKAFLRPDSLLAVILLTDENDCSLQTNGLGSLVATQGNPMPRPRSECAENPDDPCCRSCIDAPGECAGDGGCEAPGCGELAKCPGNFFPVQTSLDEGALESSIKTRCADQKRRFGRSFLYPTQRYVNAFSQPIIDREALDLGTDGEGAPNPIFTDLQGLGRAPRSPDQVFVAGIAGVPWQLIARKNAAGEPDLVAGLDAEGREVGGYQTHAELEASETWRQMLPESDADQPDDPLMIESRFPRTGLSSKPDSNPINGNEWDTEGLDLQYACIFDLPESILDCTGEACDCRTDGDTSGNPLCNPAQTSEQVRAKAYPGTRVFEVLRGLGPQGVVASICPAQLAQEPGQTKDDKNYGYTPAVFAIIDQLKTKLQGSCQPRELQADDDGDVPCLVLEARDSDGDANPSTSRQCSCDGAGRRPIGDESEVAASIVRETLEEEQQGPGFDCLCEVVQLAGEDRVACQNELKPAEGVDGWCYVDAAAVPPVGNPALVASCPETEPRLVRLVNEGKASQGARQYITCTSE